jgi:hypothetical protein
MEGNMAAKDVKRSIQTAQAKRLRLNPHLRLRVYETLYHLNRGFTLTVMNLDRLERLGLFRRDYLRAYRHMAEELRAKTNSELTSTLHTREWKESAMFGRLVVKAQKRFQFPEDQRILAERKRLKRSR